MRTWLLAVALDLLPTALVTSPGYSPPLLKVHGGLDRWRILSSGTRIGRRRFGLSLDLVVLVIHGFALADVVIVLLWRFMFHGLRHVRGRAVAERTTSRRIELEALKGKVFGLAGGCFRKYLQHRGWRFVTLSWALPNAEVKGPECYLRLREAWPPKKTALWISVATAMQGAVGIIFARTALLWMFQSQSGGADVMCGRMGSSG